MKLKPLLRFVLIITAAAVAAIIAAQFIRTQARNDADEDADGRVELEREYGSPERLRR